MSAAIIEALTAAPEPVEGPTVDVIVPEPEPEPEPEKRKGLPAFDIASLKRDPKRLRKVNRP